MLEIVMYAVNAAVMKVWYQSSDDNGTGRDFVGQNLCHFWLSTVYRCLSTSVACHIKDASCTGQQTAHSLPSINMFDARPYYVGGDVEPSCGPGQFFHACCIRVRCSFVQLSAGCLLQAGVRLSYMYWIEWWVYLSVALTDVSEAWQINCERW